MRKFPKAVGHFGKLYSLKLSYYFRALTLYSLKSLHGRSAGFFSLRALKLNRIGRFRGVMRMIEPSIHPVIWHTGCVKLNFKTFSHPVFKRERAAVSR